MGRVAFEPLAVTEEGYADGPSGVRQQSGDHPAVATIGTRAGQNHKRAGCPAAADCGSHSSTCILHQGNAGDAAFDRGFIRRIHFRRLQEFEAGGSHGVIPGH